MQYGSPLDCLHIVATLADSADSHCHRSLSLKLFAIEPHFSNKLEKKLSASCPVIQICDLTFGICLDSIFGFHDLLPIV